MKLVELIGNTPLAEMPKLANSNVKLFGKLEGNNPGGSVKDRAAYYMFKNALARKEINSDMNLIEPTSGNTGIALAMMACLFNLKIELIMPANATKERVQTMRAFGAKVTLTASEKSMEGAIDYARMKVKEEGCFMLNQFGNFDNPQAHYETTGPEIWRDTQGKITHFVSSMGTTGTIMGVSRFLKEQNPNIQIIGVQPQDGSNIPGIRRWPPEYLPVIFDKKRVDRIIDVSQEESVEMTRRMAKEEGIFAGMSSGGATVAAVKICKELDEGLVVTIVCDRGDRYLSSSLFDIPE